MLLIVLVILALLPASAAADGLPATGVDARPLSLRGGDVEYVTERARGGTRLIERERGGGPIVHERRIAGAFSVPAVAYDGTPSGLSADGRTLVLINPRKRFPRARTTFAVLDAERLRLRRQLRLSGDFSFDALSPDGRLMYLIQYTDRRNLTKYAVRAYDMRARRLLPGRVVDPSEPDEDMSGLPITRATGADGRWEYTLYDGNSYPFVHALDTERRRAACIDLHALEGRSLMGLKLQPRDGRLDVVAGPKVLARIDTSTHELIRAAPRPPEARFPWLLIAGPTAVLLGLAAVTRRLRARKGSFSARAA